MLRRLPVCLALLTLSAAPALAQDDSADAIVRLNRMENQFRQLSGQIEQLQYDNKQLKDQLRKFQEDVEFRFQDLHGSPKASSPSSNRPPAQPSPQRRSDAYDPDQMSDAPGAPHPLGTTPPSPSLNAPGGNPARTANNGIGDLIEQDDPSSSQAPLDLSQGGRTASVAPQAPAVSRPGPSVAATGSGDPRQDYDTAYAFLVQKQYDQAEMSFRRFLQSNPRDKLVPDAAYWLGESYFQRNRYREAAEQFLNVSADYPDSAKAPDSLLKLGVSLNALGARDRACAVFVELGRKYPQASPSLRQSSDREQKRAKCS